MGIRVVECNDDLHSSPFTLHDGYLGIGVVSTKAAARGRSYKLLEPRSDRKFLAVVRPLPLTPCPPTAPVLCQGLPRLRA